jgi:hypothetical protein
MEFSRSCSIKLLVSSRLSSIVPTSAYKLEGFLEDDFLVLDFFDLWADFLLFAPLRLLLILVFILFMNF